MAFSAESMGFNAVEIERQVNSAAAFSLLLPCCWITTRNGMHLTSLLATVVGAFVLGVASAAPPKWTKEPDTVMGIKLGALWSSVPNCPPGVRFSDKICDDGGISNLTNSSFHLAGLPFRDVIFDGGVSVLHGNIAAINLTLVARNFDQFSAILTERYGSPTVTESHTVVARNGATFPSRTYKWIGAHMSITFIERSTSVNDSSVTFLDNHSEPRRRRA